MDEQQVRAGFLRTLGLKPGATAEEIKTAWRTKAKEWHPDRVQHNSELAAIAQEKLKEINEAYECLTDPVAFRKYMSNLARKANQSGGKNTGDSGTSQKESDRNQQSSSGDQNKRTFDETAIRASARGRMHTAAKQAAVTARERQEWLKYNATDLYSAIHLAAIAEAKRIADETISSLQKQYVVPLQFCKDIYGDAQTVAREITDEQMSAYKNEQEFNSALREIWEKLKPYFEQARILLADKQKIQMAAIATGSLVILCNTPKMMSWLQVARQEPQQEIRIEQPAVAAPARDPNPNADEVPTIPVLLSRRQEAIRTANEYFAKLANVPLPTPAEHPAIQIAQPQPIIEVHDEITLSYEDPNFESQLEAAIHNCKLVHITSTADDLRVFPGRYASGAFFTLHPFRQSYLIPNHEYFYGDCLQAVVINKERVYANPRWQRTTWSDYLQSNLPPAPPL